MLVHGAWADSSSWNDVVPRLHHDGYRTAAPDLGLVSLAADVAQVRAVLDSIPGSKILVAHSYGGIVVSDAAAGRFDVLALVFSAAFVPDQGDSIASLGAGFTPSDAFNHLAFTGAHTIEFPDASHVGGITRDAAQFTALVERAAHATTR